MRFALFLATFLAGPAVAAPCGGTFSGFIGAMKSEAVAAGYSAKDATAFFSTARQDPATLKADRAQGIFQFDFIEFSRRVISKYRMQYAQRYLQELDPVLDRIEQDYGVSRGVILAFWALETDFGQVQGDFNTLNSLTTLGHDCRRPEVFQPQIFAALDLFTRGDFDPATTTGAWAGEIGMVQMLPGDIIRFGRDGDGDGHIQLKTSIPDALNSGAALLRGKGWRPNEPWLQEIVLPAAGIEWAEAGIDKTKSVREWERLGIRARNGNLGARDLPASILLPMGRKGPAFIAYPNFQVYFNWNLSFVYVTTAAYFATRIEGAPIYNAGEPEPGLAADQMKALQRKLQARGYDVGEIDGILGKLTRDAVRSEQTRLGLPADSWPTRDLLDRL